MSGFEFEDDVASVEPAQLEGFFDGWPDPPTPETHARILRSSHAAIVAIEPDTGRVAGFVTAVSDGVLSAYIPLLEVRREHRSQGLGRELVERMLEKLRGLYMIDVSCDPELEHFYTRLGFTPARAMLRRDYGSQSGRRSN